LNPWTHEIYAFPDKQNGIVPVVGVDGWSRLMNSNPEFDGMEVIESDDIVTGEDHKPCPRWIECRIYRKGRTHYVPSKERFDECYRPPFVTRDGRKVSGPWQTHTSRMLRHKAVIQAARMAFGFAGIYDPDEADRIIEAGPVISANPRDGLEVADPVAVDSYVGRITDTLAQDVEEEIHADGIFAIHLELNEDASLYVAVQDALKARKIIAKKGWDALVALGSKRWQESRARPT
jgi:phage recombination protein Bet